MKMERTNAVVNTPSGKLQGSFLKSCLGDEYYAFKGIPYAKPPIGQLRFRDPQPLDPWTDIRDATSHGPICAQFDVKSKKIVGSEDCLYLNVYTRSLDVTARAPVMFYIHGGIFYFGSGDDAMFGPDYLLSKNVVLVTVNYRLGVFGFLDLRDKIASGNQGLKDEVIALKWLQTHITHFGGDPENITIFGGSAGAASVHYLAMSPMAKGLFHKAICQSATALSPLTMTRLPDPSDLDDYFERLRCRNKDTKARLEFLKGVNFERLIEVQMELATPKKFLQGTVPFLPTIDNESEVPFMPTSSVEAAKRGIQVPFMIGWNEMESLICLDFLKGVDLSDVDRNFENYTSPFTRHLLESNDLTIEEMRYLYFKKEAINEKTVMNMAQYAADMVFVENIHRLVRIQMSSSSAPTYLYKLMFDKNLSLSKAQMNTTIRGPNHGDELMYLFRAKLCDTLNMVQLQEGTGGERVMRQIVELWTNFAKTGRPTLETSDLLPVYWLPVANDVVLRYLNIDEELRMEKGLNIEQFYAYKKN